MSKKSLSLIIKILAVVSVIYWGFVLFTLPEKLIYYDITGLLLTVVPLLGVFYALEVRKDWGGFQSHVGKSITFIMMSLIAWTLGQALFLYYSVAFRDVPYPGPPDYFFVFMDPFYTLAMIMIMKYSGAVSNIKKSYGYLVLFLVPIASIAFNFRVFVLDGLFGELQDPEVLFSLIYTFGSTVSMALIVMTVVLSVGKLGGKIRYALYFIFVGIVLQYFADLAYSYAELQETDFLFSLADFVFFLSLSTVIFGLMKFDTEILNHKSSDGSTLESKNG